MIRQFDDKATGLLCSLVTRIEELEEEKRNIANDQRALYAQAKAQGFEPAALRTVIRQRRQPAAERREMEALLDLYRSALGM